jgi:sulfite exporter TauE/SafE
MAIVLLETTLQLSEKEVEKLIEDQEKIVILLTERSFSYKLIGLIVILLGEKVQRLPMNLQQCLESEY